MSFWEMAAVAFVGGVGVLLLTGLLRFGWLAYKMWFTPMGRFQTKAGMSVDEALRDLERRERERTDSDATL